MVPLSAGAATGRFGGFWHSTVTYPAGSFLAQVQANPTTTYRVIVQVQSRQREHAVTGWAGTYGRAHAFSLIKGVSLRLPGWAILFVAQHKNMFGGVTVTPDLPMQTLSAPDNGSEMQWPTTVGANALWSHPAVPCPVDSTGTKIDSQCQDVPAYNAPQAPAIAIVDTGIDPTKAADFGSRIVASVDFSSLSPAGATGDQMGHGTMVAGIAAGASAEAPGVAQNAPLVDVRTGDGQGESLTSDVISALDWIDANKATYNIRVANMSMAGNQATSFRNDPLDKAVEQLWLNGVVVVAAAGNNGNADGTPSSIGAPANDPFVITVGGTDQASTVTPADDTRAPWSAYGRTIDGFAKPEISAPARYMVAPVPMDSLLATTEPSRIVAPGYMWMSGTSFAAPQVSGAAADILALHPTWTPDQVKGALMVTASKTADSTGGTGVGELNAVAAAIGVANPPNPNLHLNDFVTTSATSGENVFDAAAWADYAKANPSWAPADYASSDWAVSDWAVSDWAVSDWAVSDWAVSDWAVSDWAVS
ncbi:MAG TPA: S8 family serine peptidase, partial [Gaiellaceae bacterium]|nr:S8 family serine peptidase [Gaiellaceae bacterium]